MNFLPAIPLSAISSVLSEGFGGIATNVNGTLCASVNHRQHCVYICSVDGSGELTADTVVFGTAGISGSGSGQLDFPACACFVHRNGAETLLIADFGNDRVVEVTATGVFLRAIALKEGMLGIAYCGTSDVIAVSLFCAHAVVLRQYESGVVKPEVTIGSGTEGSGDGQLCDPHGVTFTADGLYILVADWGNERVSKFRAASGAFIAHVATKAANGIFSPRDVLQCEDGSIVVAQGDGGSGSVVCVGQDGGTVQNIMIPSAIDGTFHLPVSLSYCVFLKGVVVRTYKGGLFLLRDAWFASSRSAWLSALACS
jgi:hypothetical protein